MKKIPLNCWVVLFLANVKIVSSQSDVLSGHVCSYSTSHYRVIYYTKTDACCDPACWNPRCHVTKSKHLLYYNLRHRCCAGWNRIGYQCISPICSTPCQNGGTCIRPNTCECPSTHYGSNCQYSQCSWQFPCFPGLCSRGNNCTCSTGFGGSHCTSIIGDAQRPLITSCNATLLSGNKDQASASTSCPNQTTLYVTDHSWDYIKIDLTSSYQFTSAPARPPYIRDLVLGIVENRAHVWLKRKDGRSVYSETVTCSNGDSSKKPNQGISNCNVENKFSNKIQHEDRMDVTIYAKNGGYKEVFNQDNGNVTTWGVTGLETSRQLSFVFDYKAPVHLCKDLKKCTESSSALITYVAKNGSQPQLEIQWTNWIDETSGIERYVYTIYRGNIQSGAGAIREEEWKPGDPWAIQIVNTGQYTVVLSVVDRAGNEATTTKVVNVDEHLPTVGPNLCVGKDCYPGFCVPNTGKCICFAGFSGDNCNTISGDFQDPKLEDTLIQLTSGKKDPLVYENTTDTSSLVDIYTEKVDYASLNVSWKALYEMVGDLPPRPPTVSDFMIGLISSKAQININSGGSDKKAAILDCTSDKVTLPTMDKILCMKSHSLTNTGKNQDILKIALQATTGGYKVVSGQRVDFKSKTLQRQVNIHYDTEAPYYYCAAGAGKCDGDELKVLISQQIGKTEREIILTLTWGDNWRDSLAGIDYYKYYIYSYPGKRDITLEDSPLMNGSWVKGDLPTFIAESTDNAYTVIMHVVDKAGNNATVRKDVDLTSPEIAILLGSGTSGSQKEDISGLAALPVIGCILILLAVLILVRRRIGHPWPWKDEKLKFWKGGKGYDQRNFMFNYAYEADEDQGIYYESEAYGRCVHISSDRVTLGDMLCNGHFAIIRHAEWAPDRLNSMPVIAKVLKDSKSKIDRQLMMEKIDFLGNVPRHENVLGMLGKVTDDIQTGSYMILEFCRNGSLRDWLLAQKAKGELSTDTADRIAEYAVQIASAMEHLSNNKIVHKKLMSKNVLLNGKMVAKVMGFGPEGTVTAKDKNRLPTKWMALEVLQDPQLNFTTASDVWAYGITLWEIYSLGDLPYTTGSKDKLIALLENGTRPDKPFECPDDVYNQVLLKCLCYDPTKRPSFQQIKNQLNDYLHPAPDDSGMYYGL